MPQMYNHRHVVTVEQLPGRFCLEGTPQMHDCRHVLTMDGHKFALQWSWQMKAALW